MRYTYEQPEYLDRVGVVHLVQELKVYIQGILDGDIDVSSYVTKEELQAKLDALDINVDLSSYATKEELTTAISNIDLSAYATKADIPSLDGYATKTYVDQNKFSGSYNDLTNKPTIPSTEGLATKEYVSTAINSIPATDLTNYYTKEQVYNKTEVDTMVAGAGSSNVLSMKEWKELNTKYNENFNFLNKKVYIDTTKALKDYLDDTTYAVFFYNADGSMHATTRMEYIDGVLEFHQSEIRYNEDGSISGNALLQGTLYDKSKANGETWTFAGDSSGKWVNGWRTATAENFIKIDGQCIYNGAIQMKNDITTPNFGFVSTAFEDTYDINGKELYLAFMKCVSKIEDENGNEVSFKTIPTTNEYLEYVNAQTGVDLTNYYTKDEVYTKKETEALIPTVTNGKDGADGYTPVRGTDYWTQEDINTIKAYINTELGVIENGSY